MNETAIEMPTPPADPPAVPWWNRLLRILVALIFVGAGIAGAAYLQKTGPKARKRPPAEWVPLVQVATLTPARHKVAVAAMGTVVPARTVVLKSRVGGQVVALHPEFTVGGFVPAGARLVRLDDADYRLALAREKSQLVNSRYALQLEEGRQEVARREWEILGGASPEADGDASLALRRPHLDKVRADVTAAEAAVEKAGLDLERTEITAPFNAVIRSHSVEIGSQVAPQGALAELVGTDAYRVQVSVPVRRLEWIRIPTRSGEPGSPARIRYAGGYEISGTVIRLLSDLADTGRMARVLVEVPDPLGLSGGRNGRPPLLIGEFVAVEIEGRAMEGVFAIPRTALRDGDTVWLATAGGTLDIRRVRPVWRDADTVVVENDLAAGDRIVVSALSAPAEGMRLRVEGEAQKDPTDREAIGAKRKIKGADGG